MAKKPAWQGGATAQTVIEFLCSARVLVSLHGGLEVTMVRTLGVVLPLLVGMAPGGVARADAVTQQADVEVKKLLVLMDQDRSGTVSKDEFMSFMSQEFDRLDVNKDGVLNIRELEGLRVRNSPRTGGAGSK